MLDVDAVLELLVLLLESGLLSALLSVLLSALLSALLSGAALLSLLVFAELLLDAPLRESVT